MRSRESCLCTTKAQILYFIVWWWPGSHFIKSSAWRRPNNELQMLRCFCHAQMCLCCTYRAHMFVFTCSCISNTLRPPRSKGHLHFLQSTPIEAYMHVWLHLYCHCRILAPLSLSLCAYIYIYIYIIPRSALRHPTTPPHPITYLVN